jgi:ribosomal protein S18 acetylase RimI-like enzyme
LSTTKIEIATHPSDELFQAVSALLPQLSPTGRLPTRDQLNDIISSSATRLFLAIDGTEIVGMLTLVLVRIPTGLRAHIEDVVVAKPHRRRGFGEALTKAALDVAQATGVRTVDLTSRPSRTDAVRLYERLGFRPRMTGVFRFSFDEE